MSSMPHFDKWQLSVLEYYNSVIPHQNTVYVYCPIMGVHFHPSDMAIIRLVPSTEESRHIAYQFGDLDDVEADKRIIGSEGNGLVMYRGIADRFLNGELMIVPLDKSNPKKLGVILLNEIIGICRIPGFRGRYWSLDRRLLKFKNGCRPDLRCLHWRYIINLERATNRSWLQIGRTVKWDLPGPFMRKGIIQHMDLSSGRRGIPNETAFADTICDGVEPKDAVLDTEIACMLGRSVRGNRSRSETSRHRSGQFHYTLRTYVATAMNQGPNASGSGVPTPEISALIASSDAIPGTIGPIGTMPGAA